MRAPLNVISCGLTLRSVATLVVTVASVWFAIAACWGIFGPITGAHAPTIATHGIAAENMLAWHIWGPVPDYVTTRPSPLFYDPYEPWGTFWAARGLMALFGRHAFVPRLAAVLASIATPPLLYAIGRALWGPMAGALAALAYVVVPISLAFAGATGSGPELVFGCLVTTWGYVRFSERWKRRWLAVSLIGVAWTVNAAWEGSVFVAVILAWLLVAHYVVPRWFGRPPALRFGQWWAFSMAILALTVAGYAGYFVHLDAVDRILTHLATREQAQDPTFRQLLAQRSYWIGLAYGPVATGIAHAALPVFLFRILLLRRPREAFPLALFVTAAATHVHAPTDAGGPLSLPLVFAAYWALSLGVFATAVVSVGRWGLRQRGLRDVRGALPKGAFIGLGVVPFLVLPDGLIGLSFGRRAGGPLDAQDPHVFQERGKAAVLEWMSGRMKPGARVQLHASLHPSPADEWALHHTVVVVEALPSRAVRAEDRYFVADLAFMSAPERATLASQFHVVAVGPLVFVDRASSGAPADGYVLDVRSPGALDWYLEGVDPVVAVRADPWITWELRDAFGQSPNPAPAAPPRTSEELRIAHNVAVEAGDVALAADIETKLVESLLVFPAVTFTDGTRLLGEHVDGVAQMLDVYLAAESGPSREDLDFQIQSSVQAKPRLSLVPRDTRARVLGPPMVIPPKSWKRGFIYVSRTAVPEYPGTQTVAGAFVGLDKGRVPKPRDGSAKVRLLTIE